MIKFNTFSIVGQCEKTGQLGVAVSTKVPAVGHLCPYAKAGVGAICTQSFTNPYLGINGLKYLEKGLSASETLERVLSEDPKPELRQVIIVDGQGNTAAFTGEKCDDWFGDITGENFAVAGNMLVGEDTIKDMAITFETKKNLKLSERLLQSLEAGQLAGGDKRGKQSAAILVVDKEDYPLLDLRVDDHSNPVNELKRLYAVAQKSLTPFVDMMPTKDNPGGTFDLDYAKEIGLIQE